MQDREEAANALGNSYKWDRNVLSLFLNIASVMSGVRRSAGRLFHTRGPWRIFNYKCWESVEELTVLVQSFRLQSSFYHNLHGLNNPMLRTVYTVVPVCKCNCICLFKDNSIRKCVFKGLAMSLNVSINCSVF